MWRTWRANAPSALNVASAACSSALPLLPREFHIDSLIVDWNRAQLRAGGAKSKACAGKARVLNPDLITRIKEYLRDGVERVLCALDDKNLFRRATHGTRDRQALCNC